MSTGVQEAKGTGSSGTGMAGGCEPSSRVLEVQFTLFNSRVIFPVPKSRYLYPKK